MIPTSLILPQSLMEVKQALVSKMVCTLTNNVCKQCCFIDIVFIVICSTQSITATTVQQEILEELNFGD